MGRIVVQCAVTITIARGALAVPTPRIVGTIVDIDLISSACAGSLNKGIGPPPWHTATTGADMVLMWKVWLTEQLGILGRRNKLETRVDAVRFKNSISK